MLKEAKAWIAHLEEVLTRLAETYHKELEEVEEAWEEFWYDGGDQFDRGPGPSSIEAFESEYRAHHDSE